MENETTIKDVVEKLREAIANYFTGNSANADEYMELIKAIGDEIIIDESIFENLGENFSIKDIIEIIEEITQTRWNEWRYSIDFSGGFYYLKFKNKSKTP